MNALSDLTVRSATISCLVENEAGVLARVIGLFSGRGYNIDSLTVAAVDDGRGRSRINIVTSGTAMVIEQIKAQLDRLVPVYRVGDLSMDGPHLARELALVKVIASGQMLVDALLVAGDHGARVLDATTDSFIFELSASSERLDAFIAALRPLGLAEISRTGVAAMACGTNTLADRSTPDFVTKEAV